MKMGSYDIKNMKEQIKQDLYSKKEEKLQERRTEIARKNRDLFIEPFMSTMSALPDELISHAKEYKVSIKYTASTDFKSNYPSVSFVSDDTDRNTVDITESWLYKSDDFIINPITVNQNRGYYSDVPENPLDDQLKDEADKLCQDILKLQMIKNEMTTYLDETTKRYTGSLQLRKVWPESLHKYLPKEPPKKVYTKMVKNKKVPIDDPVVPDTLNDQFTENLLEGA